MDTECKAVIFSRPGESGLIPYIGALWAAESINYLDTVNVWICPSTTAFITVMKICGYSCIDIMTTLINVPQLTLCPIPFKNSLNLGTNMHEIKGIVCKLITDSILSENKHIPTLQELYEMTGITLVGIGFSLQGRQEIENIHRESYPKMSLVDFVCISLSVPGIYRPYKIGSDMWIDGSIMEPFSPNSIELESGKILVIASKPKKMTFVAKDPITQVQEVMRCVFESHRGIPYLKKEEQENKGNENNKSKEDYIIVEINSTSDIHAIQLRDGWDAFTDSIGVPISIITYAQEDVDLQT